MEKQGNEVSPYLKCGFCRFFVKTSEKDKLVEHCKSAHKVEQEPKPTESEPTLESVPSQEVDDPMHAECVDYKSDEDPSKQVVNRIPVKIDLKVRRKSKFSKHVCEECGSVFSELSCCAWCKISLLLHYKRAGSHDIEESDASS